ncbi:MAG TPA: serine--tRNA ligase, partial [Deltaproteobacteria bacterium]|nr:serine--tRNA ligase [Deltaproteobacteria bacterium]
MLEMQYIRNNTKDVVQRLAIRGLSASELIDEVLEADEIRRKTQQSHDEVLANMNSGSKKIGELFHQGKKQEAEKLKEQTSLLKEEAQSLQRKLAEAEESLKELMLQIPNTPNFTVPAGMEESDNEIVFQVDELPQLPEDRLAHWDLMQKYDLVNMELGVKLTGAGFPVYLGKGARFQRALINFFLDEAIEAGYKELIPPLLVNTDSAFATGQLPDKDGQMYHIRDDDFYLIPTAEIPITNVYRD